MGDDRTDVVTAPTGKQRLTNDRLYTDGRGACRDRDGATAGPVIALIENRVFLQECIRRSMQSAFAWPFVTYATVSELERQLDHASIELVILSGMSASNEGCASALEALSKLVPGAPVIILSSREDVDLARIAISHGARAYIPCTMGFELAVAAVQFVLAGGSYAPVNWLTAIGQTYAPASPVSQPGGVTPRELAVVQALQEGKSNKTIAYELNMCESTVKVHIRNIMKKWKARNRTEVAIKAQAALEAVSGDSVAPPSRIERFHTSRSAANSTMRTSSAPNLRAIFPASSSVSASEPAQ